MKNERCLKKLTGSCGYCNVYQILKRAVNSKGEPLNQATNRIGGIYCPPNENPIVRTETVRGGMGQSWMKSKRVV